ncbi:hypothetical protein CLV97_11139 [Planifilum fimeticola]|jgi:hypothetical protein|uniref:Uncharacterized protein n=1 Tax=Planifilum fimeticola TaxID=201975 RepID=A0A2T0LEV4_9BACL|nr:hypothetical protein [Planifilum fimeticola]PRX40697.1 hypothetical protein CLV97_11139 [Planifilum fimeticola]
MSTRKNRSQRRAPENRPVVIWSLPAPRGNSSRNGEPAPKVVSFSGPRSVREEAAVTEWMIPARQGQDAKITIISSGFGIPAGRNPQNRCMAA